MGVILSVNQRERINHPWYVVDGNTAGEMPIISQQQVGFPVQHKENNQNYLACVPIRSDLPTIKKVSNAEMLRLMKLITNIVTEFLNRIRNKSDEYEKLKWADRTERLKTVIQQTIEKSCKYILEAAEVKPKLIKEREILENDLATKRKELKDKQTEIRMLCDDKNNALETQKQILKIINIANGNLDSTIELKIPFPNIMPSDTGAGLPNKSGIYFIWDSERIVYVGQSVNLRQRVRLSHEKILKTDVISYIECEKAELTWVECLYIGALKPKRNFNSDILKIKYMEYIEQNKAKK